jgi:hypothetical protein
MILLLFAVGEPSQDSSQGLGLFQVLADAQPLAEPDRRKHQLRQEGVRRFRRKQPRRRTLQRDQISSRKYLCLASVRLSVELISLHHVTVPKVCVSLSV